MQNVSMIKYRTTKHRTEIEAIEVVRESEHSVWLPEHGTECREAKVSHYQSYFDTWEEAHSSVLARTTSRLESLRSSLEFAQAQYDAVAAMKP